jgi:aconitase A
MDVFDAAEAYRPESLIILAGKDYGCGETKSLKKSAACQGDPGSML